ncbi:hypothetical protein SAMN04487866_1267 [Thermoactinomyces sp. DSM 45891]|uniref:hypothetical protein n=1 Tax=Thermoactinomyces sp. DSM 45891 TaxID=1761907 RepID=UPI000911DE50|nr:hypothetical protein [Thermoactinomyces sp. DSM 45891]SFX79171.1 hypothetical protein SAMN04487866_1267 [Thermoactinomyces sp. DSM 45891]
MSYEISNEEQIVRYLNNEQEIEITIKIHPSRFAGYLIDELKEYELSVTSAGLQKYVERMECLLEHEICEISLDEPLSHYTGLIIQELVKKAEYKKYSEFESYKL